MSEKVSTENQEVKGVDLFAFLRDFLHSLKRMWPLVALITAAAVAFAYYRVTTTYTPRYVADATVSVELVNGGTYANRNTAEQMGLIFPYILTSGALSDVIASDLGTRSVPGTISAKNIKGTNLLTISATASKAETAYNILQSVLKNYPEVAQYVVGQAELTVIDESGIPQDTGRTAVIRGSVRNAALIGLAIGLAIVVVRAALSRTVRSESELRDLVNVPCLGTLPVCSRKKRSKNTRMEINILTDNDKGDYVESMRLIRTRLERRMAGGKVLMVTSSVAGEGKSTVSANLAISMALKGKKVILVDCDLRNPSSGKIFHIEESYPGLVAVLKGEATIDEALCEVKHNDESTGLFLMPGADTPSRLVEILGSEEMSRLIEQLKERADVVILDTPPSAVLVDAMILVKHVDAVAYVIMCDYARRRYIFDGIEELTSGGANIAGCILNGGSTHSGRYGYYGSYGKYGYGRYGYSRYGYSRYGYSHYGSYGSKDSKKKD